jgi:hypothetical protein
MKNPQAQLMRFLTFVHLSTFAATSACAEIIYQFDCSDLSPFPEEPHVAGDEIRIDDWPLLHEYADELAREGIKPELRMNSKSRSGFSYIVDFTTTFTLRINEPADPLVYRWMVLQARGDLWICNSSLNPVVFTESASTIPTPTPVADPARVPDIYARPFRTNEMVYTLDGEFVRLSPILIQNNGTADLVIHDLQEWVSVDWIRLFPVNFAPGMTIPPGGERIVYMDGVILDPEALRKNRTVRFCFYIRSNDPDSPLYDPRPDGYRVSVLYSAHYYNTIADIPEYLLEKLPPNPDFSGAASGIQTY